MDLLAQLNPMQKQAVLTTEGPLLLLAGAGSGKTRVLTHRMAYMVENGVDPFNILAITFTNKAAREMKERVNGLVPKGADIWVSTFHSCCVRILRREINKIDYANSFTIYDMDDTEKLMKSLIKELNINEKQFPAKAVLGEIGRQKDELIAPDDFAMLARNDFRLEKIAILYQAYQKKLKMSNALDFDDIIFKTVELFMKCPEVLERYRSRFKYIMVDEYQDTNTSQYQLVRLLSSKYQNLCVVGDDDQSIYGWRGANIRNILDFEKDYPNTVTLKLEQNYRSTGTILEAANTVIANNIGRKGKKLWTDKEDGKQIKYFKAGSDFEEAEFVATTIMAGVQNGACYKDYAVLYRMNSQSRVLEDQLVHKSIRYRIFGGVRFYERREIKDVLAYLKAVYNPLDDVAVKRIINVPRRGIGGTTVDHINEYASASEIPFYGAMKEIDNFSDSASRNKKIKEFTALLDEFKELSLTMPVSELVNQILERTGYILELMSEGTDEAKDRVLNVQELVTKALEFEKQSENPLLADFLEDIALVADIDNFTEDDDTVVLMTLHSSKGLEFPVVFIPGFEEGIFPGYRTIMSSDMNELEEERRLCYVGITRAREQLIITTANQRRQHGQIVCNAPSRFLKEIPVKLIDGMFVKRQAKAVEATRRTMVDESFLPKRPEKKDFVELPKPNCAPPDYEIGDKVRQMKYGVGTVLEMKPAGVDYEVSVEFPGVGTKKFMAHLSKLAKV